MDDLPTNITPEERLQKQLRFISNRLDEISINPETKKQVLKLIEVDLRKRIPKTNSHTSNVQVNQKTHGDCLACGTKNVELVDGFLCENCYENHAKGNPV